jgi:hypothetical protein
MGMTDINKTDTAFILQPLFHKTDEGCKEIMSETILILNMDSHFHGNDRHKFVIPAKAGIHVC